jgi:DNA-directed RNA polymerase specialized sigma24 family protein
MSESIPGNMLRGDTITMRQQSDDEDDMASGVELSATDQDVMFRDCLDNRLAPMLSIAQLMHDETNDTGTAEQVVTESAMDAYARLNGEKTVDECAARLSCALVRRLVPQEELEKASSQALTVDPKQAGLDHSEANSLSAMDAEAVVCDADMHTVDSAFKRLPRLERLVLAMITVGNHTTAEVSRMMETTRRVIRRLRVQAQKRLNQELADLSSSGA